MTMGNYIKELRLEKEWTQDELGQKLNPPVNKSAVNKWEKGQVENIKKTHIEQMSKFFGVRPSQLMCFNEPVIEGAFPIEESVPIPILGKVAAGEPILAVENQIGTVNVDHSKTIGSELFGLRIKGDSMSPRIQEGDIVIVRKQSDADSGDIVIALVNGDEAVCKRLQKYADGLSLISLNPQYEPMTFTKKDIKDKPVKIIGRVIENRQQY